MGASRLLTILTSDPSGPVVRHRWLAFEEALAEADVRLEIVPWSKPRRARRHALQRAETADGVLVSSRLLTAGSTRALRERARRLAFDFDDALPFRDSARGARPSFTRRRRFRTLVQASDHVFAGNSYLAALASAAGRTAEVLPTVVDVPDGDPPPEPKERLPVLGWIGGRATIPYLDEQWILLSAVVATGRPFRLRVIADVPPTMPPGIAVEVVPWTLEGWRTALAGIHVGLAPLPDDAWTRGKCGLKVLQVMSVGRPIVASAVGVQERQVRHGVTGFLTSTREEAFDALLNLIDDADLRQRLGRAALEEVRSQWSTTAWAPRVREAVLRWLA